MTEQVLRSSVRKRRERGAREPGVDTVTGITGGGQPWPRLRWYLNRKRWEGSCDIQKANSIGPD